jgi:dipeptidyl aminopeptidase/acylaminoacyl peptidase
MQGADGTLYNTAIYAPILGIGSLMGTRIFDMADRKVAPYGSWKSPITSDLIVSQSIGLGGITADGEDIYWLESRPAEGGRNVLVRRSPDGQTRDVTPPPFNVRTRVHEYGGAAFLIDDGTVYFSNFADQRMYRQAPGGTPEPLTAAGPMRYADAVLDRARNRLICVREDHTLSDIHAANTLVSVSLADGTDEVLVSGNDFYSNPRLSSDGTRLAWLTWNHPNMPWDGTELWVAEVGPDGRPAHARQVAGGPRESVFQPEWSPDGVLHFVSDPTGWWNLYRLRDGQVEALCPMEAEFGVPQWVFGMATYAFIAPQQILCGFIEQGTSRLGILDTATGQLERIDSPYSVGSSLHVAGGRALFIGGSPTQPSSAVALDLAPRRFTVLRRSTDVNIDPGYISVARTIEFPTEQQRTAYAFFYPPRNRDYQPPAGDLPPLLVMSHGGPTSATSPNLRLGVQYWTSRGIAVLDVNYGGSTGYGRAYRRRLQGQWGVVDVDDCVNGARYLVEQGLVDGRRLAITGGSAGGYTTLCALTFRDVFQAGASHYGISDLEALTRDSHKFELHDLDNLIGPYPERRDLYIERSPIHFTDRLSCPVILLQGLEDKVVPPNQAEVMVAALRAKGLPVAYLPFAGEQHGFRRAENIKRALDAELYFYGQIFGFALADPVEPVPIENLAPAAPGGAT